MTNIIAKDNIKSYCKNILARTRGCEERIIQICYLSKTAAIERELAKKYILIRYILRDQSILHL